MRCCEICNRPAMKTCHHICSRGAHGKKALVEENEIDLCLKHHVEVHTIGAETFFEKYGITNRLKRARSVVWGSNHER